MNPTNPQGGLLELLGAGGVSLLREILASGGAVGSGALDTLNPMTPMPTLADYGNRQRSMSKALQDLGMDLPVSDGNAFRPLGAKIGSEVRQVAERYPNEAELLADVLSNPNMQGAMAILDVGGKAAPFSGMLRQGVEDVGKAAVKGLETAQPTWDAVKPFIVGPEKSPNDLGGMEALVGSLMMPDAAQQAGIVIPAGATPARALR